jgi:aryl-alcohol dehydrogenase-like predicted oxidoreductase
MNKKALGNSDLKIPPIAFGGNVFGWTLDEKESFKMLDELVDRGFDYIDTADVYSRWADGNQGGESEAIIGKWMKERGNRDKITLATKVGSDMGQGKKDISKKYILKAVEDSLQRLQTDHIDLYFTHWDDDKTPVEETLSAYDQLIKEGKIRYIGASNLSPSRLEDSLKAAERKNLPKYQAFQPEYNLIERKKFEGEIQDMCFENNLGVTSYFSLASGFLTGKYRQESDFEGQARKDFVKKYLNRSGLEILNKLDEISENHKISNAGVALAWVMAQPGITAPIASATKSSHLNAFQEAVEVDLTEKEIKTLNQVSAK